MAKRRLSRRQVQRMEKAQSDRFARANERATHTAVDVPEGDDLQPGAVTAQLGSRVDVVPEGETTARRCHVRANVGTVATGDEVLWQPLETPTADAEGVVVAVKPRRSALERPDDRGRVRVVAANVDQMMIVMAPSPPTPLNLVDRYLVAAAAAGIQPLLVLNKADLLTENDDWQEALALYKELGFNTCRVSAQKGGVSALQPFLAGQTSVLVGQSGVGKTSLVNALLGRDDLATQAVSDSTGKGLHTTTAARRYDLPGGGYLVDSPGIREFGLGVVATEAVAGGFPEILEHAAGCRFRDCRHRSEPGCAVLAAIEGGQVSPRRLDSYHRIIESMEAT